MTLTHRTCSNCNYWNDIKTSVDEVLAAQCEVGDNVTKGSFSCSKWKALKYKEQYNPYRDIMERVRDWN